MKTRKQKDNNQRLNFLRHESTNLLAQYYKKKSNSTVSESLQTGKVTGLIVPLGSSQSLTQKNASMQATDSISSQLDSFQYPKSLTTFYNKYKGIKPLLTLTALQTNKLALLEANVSESSIDGFKTGGFRMCYKVKVKAKNSKVRIRGRCIQTNRSRSVSRLLRISRIRIRTLALEGHIAGCTRAT